MKKEKSGTFFGGKGFYAALAAGAAALFAVGMISTNMISDDKKELAENPSTQVAENAQQTEENTDTTKENRVTEPEAGSQEKDNKNGSPTTNSTAEQQKKENDKKEEANELSDFVEPETENTDRQREAAAELQEQQTAEVLSMESQVNTLTFDEESGLVWPVQGDILLDYSMEKPIYFKTLAQYKCNSAIVIEAKEGTEVYSAAKGIITDISEKDETGVTITASVGNEYQIIYGQLSDVQVKVGDTVEKGAILGKVAAPTKYYVEEGSNLYFKVLEGEESINPLLLLN